MAESNKYYGIAKDIAEELKVYELKYFREDKPVPFCGLYIYPATMHDYEAFSNCSSCLTLNKNEDPEGIRMSQLDYLVSKTQIQGEEGSLWSYKIQKLFEIIFHITNGLKCKKCGRVLAYDSPEFLSFIETAKKAETTDDISQLLKCPDCGGNEFLEMIKILKDAKTNKYSLIIDGHTINKKDYDRLRQIVLFQNYPEYRDDSWVDAAVKQDYDERMKIKHNQNKLGASVERKIVCLSIATNYTFEQIYNMSIRKFTMALNIVDDLINYKIMKTAAMSGFVSLPKGQTIEHWIYKEEKDMYGDSYKSKDELDSQVSSL